MRIAFEINLRNKILMSCAGNAKMNMCRTITVFAYLVCNRHNGLKIIFSIFSCFNSTTTKIFIGSIIVHSFFIYLPNFNQRIFFLLRNVYPKALCLAEDIAACLVQKISILIAE